MSSGKGDRPLLLVAQLGTSEASLASSALQFSPLIKLGHAQSAN